VIEEADEVFQGSDAEADAELFAGVFGSSDTEFGDFGNEELARAFSDNGTCREIHDLIQES
jgi:hypothetical protein